MGLKELFHTVATGSRRRRQILTPLGLTFFGLTLLVVVFGGLYFDRILAFPAFLPSVTGLIIGVLLLVPGAALCSWCVVRFVRSHGTPVPFNPPKELIVTGPYVWIRNPMVSGVFTSLFGIGFMLNSISIVAIWTPLYIIAHVIELKKVEEPELEQRFGASYVDYRREVPMFIPRPWRYRRRPAV